MKKIALLIALAMLAGSALATKSHPVKGHTTKKGKYIAPHRATDPNKTKRDNYSSKGNSNPYTGKEGTKDPEKSK